MYKENPYRKENKDGSIETNNFHLADAFDVCHKCKSHPQNNLYKEHGRNSIRNTYNCFTGFKQAINDKSKEEVLKMIDDGIKRLTVLKESIE